MLNCPACDWDPKDPQMNVGGHDPSVKFGQSKLSLNNIIGIHSTTRLEL